MKDKPRVCLITGVGPGTGSAIARRFAGDGYRLLLNARNKERLAELEDELGNAVSICADLADPKERLNFIEAVLREGVPDIVVNNAVGGTFGNYLNIDPADLTRNFTINVEALLDIARALIPRMIDSGGGAFLATGNTSAYRGKANFAGFAPTKAAQRILLESIAREVGPKGVHCAYIAIDAVIDLAWTRKMAPDKPDDFFAQPNDIADEVYRLAHQLKSAWSFDSVIRPFGEPW
ncbi:short-chain dehydrogenase [Erythrobacter sp. QSSC1-22B]|uniref:SDR family NAD(P)-dependent oxidoreductase n=1 Tax=Erythrobacter sp. QSSC1-22B TaxID=1860125 RepID=UPI000805C6E6|nr:SDR family NAD(P)-dependent oxidoreductase [Erythrobacter sp. QSSC1-22B]OBX17700.1 short-chain dehydrogenase [Erythrobacter sp. QSSC1-22B]